MRVKLILLFVILSFGATAQIINWQPQGSFEIQRIRNLGSLTLVPKDTTGGIGFTNRDSIGSLLVHPNGSLFIKDRFGWQKVSGNQKIALDTIWRSNDTIVIRNTNGVLLGIKMDYYTKSQADNKYVKYTDTANIVAPYLAKIDTIGLSNRINTKEPIINLGVSNQYWRWDKTWQSLNVAAITGLQDSLLRRFDSTTVKNLLSTKENNITPGTTSQYWRGDKTFQDLTIAAVTGLLDTLNARKDSAFFTRIYGSIRPKSNTDSVGVGKKATQNFDVAGKSNFDDTTYVRKALLIGGAQPAVPSIYNLYAYGNTAFTGTTTWNGGIYSSRNAITISSKLISPWSAYTSVNTQDLTPVATIGFYRFQASGLGKAAYHDFFGRMFWGAYSGTAANSGQTVGAEIRVQSAQTWDTTKYGTRFDIRTTKKGAIPVVDSSTLSSKTALLIEDNQNIGIGVAATTDSAYSGRLQIRNDSALSATQPLLYAETYNKTFRWSISAAGQEKNAFLANASAGTALNVLYVDPADSTIKKGTLPTGSTVLPVVNLLLPNDLYAVEGAEFNVYNDNITLADYGKSDLQYDYVCTKGIQYGNRFSYTPLQADSGTTTLTINVYYKGAIIATKTSNLHSTTRRAGTAARSVVMIGDSQVAAGAMTDTIKADYAADAMVLTFKGTQPTLAGNYMEGRGGWQWSDYTTVGRTFYKFIVSGVTTPPSLAATYTNNSSTFTVREINISSGSGYISCERTVGTNAPLASGTLTRTTGTGDATITYSSVSTVTGNPFWNNTLSRMDVAGYLTNYSITMSSGDWWTVQLGTNDVFSYTDTTTLNTKIAAVLISIDTLINAIHADAAGTNIALVLPNPPADQDAAGSNYTNGQTSWRYEDNIKRYMKAILSKYDNATYQGNAVYVLAGNANIDLKNNMQYSIQKINARTQETYVRQINLVHPDNTGYAQFSDTYYSMLKWFK